MNLAILDGVDKPIAIRQVFPHLRSLILGTIGNMGNILGYFDPFAVSDIYVLDKGIEIEKTLEHRFLTGAIHRFNLFGFHNFLH